MNPEGSIMYVLYEDCNGILYMEDFKPAPIDAHAVLRQHNATLITKSKSQAMYKGGSEREVTRDFYAKAWRLERVLLHTSDTCPQCGAGLVYEDGQGMPTVVLLETHRVCIRHMAHCANGHSYEATRYEDKLLFVREVEADV